MVISSFRFVFLLFTSSAHHLLFQQQYPPEVRANGKAFNVIASAQFFHTGSFGMFQDKLAPLQQVNSPKRRDTCGIHVVLTFYLIRFLVNPVVFWVFL